ncbi:hypothetical protein K492DRAFT_59417 [Lichtheimia hyalospora FSU 10163]|nr:hypothetical protein K492DRAFT_59417 [Lichtheimia hyalospora FSU 10163]
MTTSSVLPPLSLKRIRSNNTFRTSADQHRRHPTSSTNESTSKFSKFKSSLSVITKFTRPFTSPSPPSPPLTPPQHDAQQQQQRTKWRHRWSQHFDKRRLSSILSNGFFDIEKHHEKYPFANDTFYEHERYRRASRSHSRLDLKASTTIATSDSSNDERHLRQNAQTMPPTPSPLPSPMMDDEDDMAMPWKPRDNHSSNNKALPASILVKRGDDSVLSNTSTTMTPTATATTTTKKANRVRSKSSSSISSKRGHHIRHKSSSNITVNSEDLTAKEFADIAGIRILDDASLSCCDNDAIMHTTCTSTRSSLQGRDYSHHRSMRSAASCSLLRPTPHIWDAEFWNNPDASCSKTISNNDRNSIKQQQQPLQEWGRRRSTSNDSSRSRSAINNCVIKKGRFEICLETAESTEAFANSNTSSVGYDEQCIPKIVTTDMDQQ